MTIKLAATADTGANLPLPGILQSDTRAGVGATDPLLAGITVQQRFHLAAASRDGAALPTAEIAGDALLALETADGGTLFVRANVLKSTLEQRRPEALTPDDVIDFTQLRDIGGAARGMEDLIFTSASIIDLPDDGILEEAQKKALEWAKEKLGEKLTEPAYDLGSFLGAKALMWAIESRLAGDEGLYCWQNETLVAADRCQANDDPRLAQAAVGKPMLLLIHGTASHTLASFGDLRRDDKAWGELRQRFPGGIFGLEHRTFSASPSENALELLQVLPAGARVSLLTHSRGGLVGDLLSLGDVKDELIDAYTIKPKEGLDSEGLAREAQEERARLHKIRRRLTEQNIVVERYVRVACPARGTRLLSDHLDTALSVFLAAVKWGGGAVVGALAGAVGGPVAGKSFGEGASSCLGVLQRLVLEIAKRRFDAAMVPGIAAMCIDSPLAAFLGNPETPRAATVNMAVIAGDTEFDGFGFNRPWLRIANLFCDWALFSRNDNDLVIDTDSMYAGLGFRTGARYLFDQGESVHHFQYYGNPLTHDALHAWLTADNPATLAMFKPIDGAAKTPWRNRPPAARRGAEPQPVAILIPGIMGSHIEIDRSQPNTAGSGERIWFDFTELAAGGLKRIRDANAANIAPDDLFERFYGDLADHLADSHKVLRCPYDWRRPLEHCAKDLRQQIEEAAQDNPGQPIRLLAHSMGGLVVRMLMQRHPDAWKKVLDSGGRLVMLGTPNNGSHLMVHALLGKSESTRGLAVIDRMHNLHDIVAIVAGFPGALALLPRPGFADSGSEPRIGCGEYYQAATWTELKRRNTDRWFGDHVGGQPTDELLNAAQQSWAALPGTIGDPARIAYVFGQSHKTPCGVQRVGDRLKLLFTPHGDGSVTWESGRLAGLDAATRCWYMPVEHADLAGTPDYFPAIVELLESGSTDQLGRLPVERGEAAPSFVLDAAPPVLPTEDELARAFLGSGPRRHAQPRPKGVLRVAVLAGDVRFVEHPVMCGHYIGDAITGAEAALDERLSGALTVRERLGVYAGEIGSQAIALRAPNGEEQARGSRPGAVIVGLGPFNGDLGARQVGETVCAGVTRFLLHLQETGGVKPGDAVKLYSLLIGWNSTANIGIAESVTATTRGVLEANRQFREACGKPQGAALAVTELCFIEMYRDAAISAARAVLALPGNLEAELDRLAARVAPAAILTTGKGVLERLDAVANLDHWARLIVTDADAPDIECAPECYEVRCVSPIPRDRLRRLAERSRCCEERDEAAGPAASDAATPPDTSPNAPPGPPSGASAQPPHSPPPADAPGSVPYTPERLKYVFLSQRARAETVIQHRQPGLIEAIIRDQRSKPSYDPKLGQTLFQFMVPLDQKATLREQPRLLLVLDRHTANLPWELLQVDGEPLVTRTPLIRQLATARYRQNVRNAITDTACIVANPDTGGFDQRFPVRGTRLPALPGAVLEGRAIRDSLIDAGWKDADIVYSDTDGKALDIFKLLARPYRVLAICAHGICEMQGRDGRRHTGAVLSDGLLIGAAEIGLMDPVPELVFVNCCHLAKLGDTIQEPNRLAHSVARELIDIGVRCVVAAGWAVNDAAAATFAGAFFSRLCRGANFGQAVFEARKTTRQHHPATNTWGAYQAYGDPGYRLHVKPVAGDAGAGGRKYVAVEELLAAIEARREETRKPRSVLGRPASFADQCLWLDRQLASCPKTWAELPDVLQAIGAFHGELGPDGFKPACQSYLRAVQAEDKSGRVAVRTIEQLANMEARWGFELTEAGRMEEGIRLFDQARDRLNRLNATVWGAGAAAKNAERAAILGSVLKLKAAALAAEQPEDETPEQLAGRRQLVAGLLAESAVAYREKLGNDPAQDPYNTLNWLPMKFLAGSGEPNVAILAALARHCGETARRQFAKEPDFWSAVMSADAAMTAWLIDGRLPKPGAAPSELETPADPAVALYRVYEEAVKAVPQSSREWDSVTKQWCVLAHLLRLRGEDERADALKALAERHGRKCAGAAAGNPGGGAHPAEPA